MATTAGEATSVRLVSNAQKVVTMPATDVSEAQHIITEDGETLEVVTVTINPTAETLEPPEPSVVQLHQLGQTHTQETEHELVVTTTPANDHDHHSHIAYIDTQILYASSADKTSDVDKEWQDSSAMDGTACLVCGDRGSGFHYSVFSCEGCKGFFKRSVQKNLTYTCKNEGNCDINKYSRNNCQYCRFKKCLQFGMKKEGVREDRTPGGMHKTSRFKRMRMEYPLSKPEETLDDLLDRLFESDPHSCPEYVKQEHNADNPATIDSASQLTTLLYEDLSYLIKWTQRVPGFAELGFDDQSVLVKNSFIELGLLRFCFRSLMTEEGRLRFAEDVELTLDEAEQLDLNNDLLQCVLDLIERLKGQQLDDKEYVILSAVILLQQDAIGITDTDSVIKLQQKYLDILRRYMRQAYPNDTRRYGRLLLRLPALRLITLTAAEVYNKLVIDSRQDITDLFTALFPNDGITQSDVDIAMMSPVQQVEADSVSQNGD